VKKDEVQGQTRKDITETKRNVKREGGLLKWEGGRGPDSEGEGVFRGHRVGTWKETGHNIWLTFSSGTTSTPVLLAEVPLLSLYFFSGDNGPFLPSLHSLVRSNQIPRTARYSVGVGQCMAETARLQLANGYFGVELVGRIRRYSYSMQ
jgi:hypothetical protein